VPLADDAHDGRILGAGGRSLEPPRVFADAELREVWCEHDADDPPRSVLDKARQRILDERRGVLVAELDAQPELARERRRLGACDRCRGELPPIAA